MTDARSQPTRSDTEGGFTLLEVLIALGIMTFGLTALIGALSLAVGTRRGAEMRVRASLLADQVMQRVENEVLAAHPVPSEWQEPQDLAIDGVSGSSVDGFPGMGYRLAFVTSPERPDLVLVELRVAWREEGTDEGETFVKILPRSVPMARRVAQRGRSRNRRSRGVAAGPKHEVSAAQVVETKDPCRSRAQRRT